MWCAACVVSFAAILARILPALALHTSPSTTENASHSTSHGRARCRHIDSRAPQYDFSAHQDGSNFAGVELAGGPGALSSDNTYEFDWGASLEIACMETTSGHQLGFTTYRAAAQDLVSGGIVMCGDSTTRNIFASMCGFHSGMSRDDLEKYSGTLKNRSGTGDIERCSKADIVFAPWYELGLADACIDAIQTTKAKYKFVSMPVLHTLWSPGDREQHGTVCTFKTMDAVKSTLSRAISSMAPHGVVFGTGTTICNAKEGKEAALCQVYKLQRKLAKSGGNPTDARVDLGDRSYDSAECVADFIASQTNVLQPTEEVATYLESVKATGIIRPTPWRYCSAASDADDGYDSLLLIEEGVQNFNDISMRTLKKYPTNLVVNMHGATEGRCNFTSDGRHYKDPVLRLQASLLATAWKLQENLAS